jgi:Major Facilitator Superfamily
MPGPSSPERSGLRAPEGERRPGQAAPVRKPTVQVHAGSTRQNVDRVVDEQAKLSDRKRQIQLWCYTARMTKPPRIRGPHRSRDKAPRTWSCPLGGLLASRLTPKLVNRIGPRRLLAGGLALAAVGLALLGRIHPTGSYPVDVAGPIVLLGLGMGLSFVPMTASATAGVPPAEQGLASGLLQTAQQLGVALGLAALTSFATAISRGLLGHADRPPAPAALQAALTGGYAAALRGTALLALAGAALAILILPPTRQPKERS